MAFINVELTPQDIEELKKHPRGDVMESAERWVDKFRGEGGFISRQKREEYRMALFRKFMAEGV